MVTAMVAGSTQLDADHFRTLLDLDGNEQVSLQEFLSALDTNQQVAAAVRKARPAAPCMPPKQTPHTLCSLVLLTCLAARPRRRS